MLSHQTTEAKLSLEHFKEQLVHAVMQAAEFAETFRPIEKFFMAGDEQKPDYLKNLCRELRSKRMPTAPSVKTQNVSHIEYKRDAKTLFWQQIKIEEKMTQEQLNQAFEKLIQLKKRYTDSPAFLNSYLLRQEEFYQSLSKKTAPRALSSLSPEIKKTGSIELLKNSLAAQLRAYSFLSPLDVSETVTTIFNILQEEIAEPACYQNLALVIFVGRDISTLAESRRVLIPEINDFLDLLAILCVNLHQEIKGNYLRMTTTPEESKRSKVADSAGAASSSAFFKPAGKNLLITEEELDLIFTLREKGFKRTGPVTTPLSSQQNT